MPLQKLRRVTSVSGPRVTSLSGVYNRDSHNGGLWNIRSTWQSSLNQSSACVGGIGVLGVYVVNISDNWRGNSGTRQQHSIGSGRALMLVCQNTEGAQEIVFMLIDELDAFRLARQGYGNSRSYHSQAQPACPRRALYAHSGTWPRRPDIEQCDFATVPHHSGSQIEQPRNNSCHPQAETAFPRGSTDTPSRRHRWCRGR